MKRSIIWLAGVFLWPAVTLANQNIEACLINTLATSDDSVTVGEIREICELQAAAERTDTPANNVTTTAEAGPETEEPTFITEDSAISRRSMFERAEDLNPFVILPHRPNYIILSNNTASPNQAPFEAANSSRNVDFQPWETQFQISLKAPVYRGIFGDNGDLFFAYTNRSFWQIFNKEGSAPFRDSNHEPEAWLEFENDYELLGFRNSIIRTGISHQSNGQSGVLSRSWNRLYADFVFERDDLYLSVKPWWRIPEGGSNDDNPDIERYMGNVEVSALYKYGEHNFDVMVRNNLRSGDNYGAVQFGWSFPLFKKFRGYVQWFNGYGESLIDYDAHTNSIGFGIQFTDWL